MTGALIAGILAGLGVAIPVGAAAVLLVEVSAERGLRSGLSAGLGIAVADGLFASVAALFGVAISKVLAPWASQVTIGCIAVLAVVAILAVREYSWRSPVRTEQFGALSDDEASSYRRTFLVFLRGTLTNAYTIVFFLTLILGLEAVGNSAPQKGAFVVGAFLASALWQFGLAAYGAHRRPVIARRFRKAVLLVDLALLTLFAIGMGLSLT